MKREVNILFIKAVDSLTLMVERFNGISDRGRECAVMILIDHAFEMFLKAALVHRGGKIRDKDSPKTIGLDACIRKALTDANVKFLNDNQALTIQAINGIRDACYHYYVEISEHLLYFHAQAGMTLFRDLCRSVFGKELKDVLPERVLPLSAMPPVELSILFDQEAKEIKKLLAPGRRRAMEAAARLRPLAIMDNALQGQKTEPSDQQLRKMLSHLKNASWTEVFPGVSALNTSADATGPSVQIRLDKKQGIPVRLVPEGTPDASVVAIKRVNELDYYSLSPAALQKKLGITMPRMIALVRHLGLDKDDTYFREFKMGSVKVKRYSGSAYDLLKKALREVSMDVVWATYGPSLSGRRKAKDK